MADLAMLQHHMLQVPQQPQKRLQHVVTAGSPYALVHPPAKQICRV